MESMHYVGFDLHKKTIEYCVKRADGTVVAKGRLQTKPAALAEWAGAQSVPWVGAMEATLFTGWVYDCFKALNPKQELKVAHPAMLRAITASKKKSDAIDAGKLADLLRCHLLPECYVALAAIRELRPVLRFRNLLVRQAVRMLNRAGGLLMEVGAEYDKRRLHGKKYFAALLDSLEVPRSVLQLLRLTRSAIEFFDSLQKTLKRQLLKDPLLSERVNRLMSIAGVGEVTALTWALEVADPHRFASIAKAVSDCGLTSALDESAGKARRGPISKQRNAQLQTVLIEAAHLAPRWNPALAAVHARELERGNKNRATLAVARKLVAYLLAVDKSGRPFEERGTADERAVEPAGTAA
jgi:transposase